MITTTAALRARAYAIASIAVGAMALFTDHGAATPLSTTQAEEFQPAQVRKPQVGSTVELEVVDQRTRAPLAGATVWVRSAGSRMLTWEGTTDEDGRYMIEARDEFTRSIEVVVARKSYVPVYFSMAWRAINFTLALDAAETIGGVVTDGQGRRIEGARVFPTYWFARVWPEIYASPNGSSVIGTTDAQGRWRLAALATGRGPDAELDVRVTHPDHVTGQFRATACDARALASVQVLKSGVSIFGTVLSPFGRPVPEATVLVARAPWDGTFIRLTTDKDGRFCSSRCVDPERPGLVLLVQATGLAWAVHHVDVKSERAAQVIRLTRRRPLEGRVVDARGEPLAGARVWLDREAFGGLVAWETQTNSDGGFVWYDAPDKRKFYLEAFRTGFPQASNAVILPAEGEVTIRLRRD